MSTAVKERPVLFSGPMVRAILAGRKTQTRRIVKPQPEFDRGALLHADFGIKDRNGDRLLVDANHDGKFAETCKCCPHGVPGDRLWVRETWTPDHAPFYPHFPAVYRADAGFEYERNEKGETYSPEQKAWFPYRWRPSIHMPRWASRITLEIVGVGVERLQDISEADALAEGVTLPDPQLETYYSGFKSLWQSINGPDSWSLNLWVWVIQFQKV